MKCLRQAQPERGMRGSAFATGKESLEPSGGAGCYKPVVKVLPQEHHGPSTRKNIAELGHEIGVVYPGYHRGNSKSMRSNPKQKILRSHG